MPTSPAGVRMMDRPAHRRADVNFGAPLVVPIVVAIAYGLGAELAWRVFGASEIGLAFFPPAGITIAAVLSSSRRVWPGIVVAVLAAELVVDVAHGLGVGTALGYGAANALEPIVAGLALQRWQSGARLDVGRRVGMGRFLVCAVGLAPLAGALVGATVRVQAIGGSFPDVVVQWWTGDALAVLALGAPVLVWLGPRGPRPVVLFEAVVAQVAVAVASVLAFTIWHDVPPSVLLLPPLVWAAVRTSVRGMGVAGATVAFVANIATAAGHGPFATLDMAHQDQLHLVQLFLGAILLTAWFLAVETNELGVVQGQRELERLARVRAESVQALGDLSRELVRAQTVDEVRAAVDAHLRTRLAIPIVVISMPDRATGRWQITPGALPADVRRSIDEWDEEERTPGLTAVRTGAPVWVSSRDELRRRFPRTAAVGSIGEAHVIGALPLLGVDGPLGFLAVARTTPGETFDRAARDALVAIAQLVSQAVQRALAHDAEHRSRLEAEESEQRFRAVADQSPLLVWVQGETGAQEWVNETACRFFGLDRDEMVRGGWRSAVTDDDSSSYEPELRDAIDTQGRLHTVVRVRRHDGALRWLESWAEPRVLADGRFAGHIGTSADVTERVEAEHRLRSAARLERFKSRLIDRLRVASDVTAVLDIAVGTLRAELDACDVSFVAPDDVDAASVGDEVRCVPIRPTDTVRTVLVVRARDGALDDEARAVVDEAADRVRIALIRVCADLEAQRRRRAARVGSEILQGLEAGRRGTDDALQVLADALVRELADEVAVEVPGPKEGEVTVLAHARCERPSAFDPRFAPSAPAQRIEVALELSPDVVATLRVLPEPAGALDTAEDDLAQLHELATRVGLVLAAARVRRAEHDIALTLQRALLPDRVHWHPNVVVEARYHAGNDLLEVGGDWYDTFAWDRERVMVTIGDVVGHNLESATAMGRLRAATSALAGVVERRPGVLLDALDRFARGPDGTSYATAVCAVLDPHLGSLTYSSAGHPPGLVVEPDGRVTTLDAVQSPPLCAFSPHVRPERTEMLAPGSVVVFYSDGLIERRGESLDDGIARLRDVVVRNRGRALGELADVIVQEMTHDVRVGDDVVAVCIRYAPVQARLRMEVDARPSTLATIRREVWDWLVERSIEGQPARDLLLAVGEACTNVVEHAYTDVAGSVALDLSDHGSHVVATVADRGSWRPHDRVREGHGMSIMRAVSSHLDHRFDRAGTTVSTCVPTPGRRTVGVA